MALAAAFTFMGRSTLVVRSSMTGCFAFWLASLSPIGHVEEADFVRVRESSNFTRNFTSCHVESKLPVLDTGISRTLAPLMLFA